MHTKDASFSATTLLRYEGPKDLAAFAPATFVPSLQGCRGGAERMGPMEGQPSNFLKWWMIRYHWETRYNPHLTYDISW